MERAVRKPVAFILTLALLLSAFCVPSFGEEQSTSLYNEASTENGIDTGFEKQTEIAGVKSQSYDGARTLSTDSHSGRFSLKIGKTGLTSSAICQIISSDIDLSKYNQVTMWVKTKGLSKVSLYTKLQSVDTLIGEVSGVKPGEWNKITFDLSGVNGGTVPGLYISAEQGKTILIDDIKFEKSFKKVEQWDITGGAVGTNTLSTLSNIDKSMSSDQTNLNEGKNNVAYIENEVVGQITEVKIESGNQSNLASTGTAAYLDCIPASTNSALYALSDNGKVAYYYNSSGGSILTGAIIRKDYTTNDTDIVTFADTKKLLTNEDGSFLALVKNDGSLYYYDAATAIANTTYSQELINSIKTNSVAYLTTISSIAVLDVFIKDDIIYYNCNNTLYMIKKGETESTKIVAAAYFDPNQNDTVNPYVGMGWYSVLTENGGSNYFYVMIRRYNPESGYVVIYREPNVTYGTASSYSVVKGNHSASMILYQVNGNYRILLNANTTTPVSVSLGTVVTSPFFQGDRMFYYNGSQLCQYPGAASLYYAADADEKGEGILYAETYTKLCLTSKTFSFDKELIIDFQSLTGATIPLTNNAIIDKVKFSTLPNQAFVQMKNGDIYSVDLKTKTSRLLINNMTLHQVLSDGKILLSDNSNTARFLIYDPVTSDKKIFRLDNRNTTSAFRITYNENEQTVYYVNNAGKMQQLLLTGSESKARYAFMLNGDGNWWSFKDNAWKKIYTGTDKPSAEVMDSQGMSEEEVTAITESQFKKLTANTGAGTLRIAVYFNTNSGQAVPMLNGIQVTTEDIESYNDSMATYGTRIKEYNKADFRDISAIHIVENKDSTDEIYYFLVANDIPYSIRNGEVCNISKSAVQLFGNVKDNYMDIMTYGMSAKELASFSSEELKEILITNNTTDKFGIVAVIKTMNKDTKEVKLDYVLESLQKRFDDAVTTVKITLIDDTLIQFTSGEVTKEEIEKFADWVADRKYNRGPVFFTFHVGGKYKVINYYMIKMFSVE